MDFNFRKLFVLLFLLVTSLNGYCCDCAELPTIKKNWETASQVFEGKIIKIDSLLYGNYGERTYSFTVKILKSYKSDFFTPSSPFRTILAQCGGSCDYRFIVGKTYLIYAKEESTTLTCSLCSRTNPLNKVEKKEIQTLESLGKEDLSKVNKIKIIKFENNTAYQIGLVKNGFEEKIKSNERIIYILSALIILLILLIILKRKS